MKERVVVETKLLANVAAVGPDLRSVRVLFGRHVAGFLEQRHIDKGGGVTLSARVSIPVPGSAKVAALFDNPNIINPALFESRASDKTRKAAANKGEGHMVIFWFAGRNRCVRVFKVVRQLSFNPDVLVIPVGSKTLIPLFAIALFELVNINGIG